MTHTFSLRYFHKVSTISFSGNSLWEDLVVLKRTIVAVLPLSLDLPSSMVPDGPALRGIPGHCQMVMYRWMGALVGAQTGLIIIISIFGLFLLLLGHVHFQSSFAISIHSLFSFFLLLLLQRHVGQFIIIIILIFWFLFLNFFPNDFL